VVTVQLAPTQHEPLLQMPAIPLSCVQAPPLLRAVAVPPELLQRGITSIELHVEIPAVEHGCEHELPIVQRTHVELSRQRPQFVAPHASPTRKPPSEQVAGHVVVVQR